MTQLSNRDLSIIRLVSRFKLLTPTHIHTCLFTTNSLTPMYRALKRLVDDGFLIKIERRLAGGDRGGSGQFVYGLGRRGWWFIHDRGTDYRRPSVRDIHHTLAIADAYQLLRKAELASAITIAGYSTEPDCHVDLGAIELRPDMFAELEATDGRRARIFIEVDMATEGQKQVRGKLDVVARAQDVSGGYGWASWPPTVWVCVDDERQKEISWLVSQMPAEQQPLFRVCTHETLLSVLGVSYAQEDQV